MTDLATAYEAFEADRPPDDDLPTSNGTIPRRNAADILRSKLLRGDTGLASLPKPAPLVQDLLDFDTLVALFGPWGSYKSFIGLDLALSIATGRTWHGRTVTPAVVVYVVAEGAAGMQSRVDAYKEHHNIDSIEHIIWLPEAVNLFDAQWAEGIAHVAAEEHAGAVVFDTLSRCMVGADENSARDMGRVVDNLDTVRRATGACILDVHHSGKNTDAGLRGSSVLAGALDTVLRVEGADGLAHLQVEKQKYRQGGETFQFKLRPVGQALVVETHSGMLDPRHLPASMIEMLIALDATDLGNGIATGAWLDGTNVPKRTFHRHVKKLAAMRLSANIGTEARPRWTLLTAGQDAIQCHSANKVPTSAMAPRAPDSATVPPPLWGGTTGTGTNTEPAT